MDPDRIDCPACGNSYPIPEQVSRGGGIRVRCPACGRSFRLRRLEASDPHVPDLPEEPEIQEIVEEEPAEEPTARPEPLDPEILGHRARRLARALLTDRIRGREKERKKALSEGTLLLIFGEQLELVWREYIHQLPPDFVEAKAIFRKAINDILADGKQLF